MPTDKRLISQDQKVHEMTAGRGFLVWIAVYLVLSLAFLVSDHPRVHHHVIASHHIDDRLPATGMVPGLPLIAHGS